MTAVLVRNLCIQVLLPAVSVLADGRGYVSGSLHRHGLHGEEVLKQLQGNGGFASHGARGGRTSVVKRPAGDQEVSRLQDSAIDRDTRDFEDLAPHLPLGSLAEASSASSASFVQMRSSAGHRSTTENNQSTELIGLKKELGNATYQSLTELAGHKHEEATRKKPGMAKPDIAMSFATAEGPDAERDARHQKEAVCYNELTVLGDLNEDGRFSPEEWHQMFKALNSKGKDTNWRISPEDFRLGLPNCDFLEFAKGDLKEEKKKDKKWRHIDYYEWQGVMENADKDRDFLLNHEELMESGFEPHSDAKSEAVEDKEKSKPSEDNAS